MTSSNVNAKGSFLRCVFFCICVFNPEKGVSSPKVKAKGDSVVGPFPNMGTTSVR